MSHLRLPVVGSVLLFAAGLSGTPAPGAESYETAPVRPGGGHHVPPPFVSVVTGPDGAECGTRHYDLRGAVPLATVDGCPVLERAELTLDGKLLGREALPRLAWTLSTPAVAIADRRWRRGDVQMTVKQTVEYDGFVTCDLTLAPVEDTATVGQLRLRLVYRPERSTLYHVSSASRTPSGFWPEQAEFSEPIPGVWGGDETAGMACYIASQRDWRGAQPRIVIRREGDGPGEIVLRLIAEPTTLRTPATYRLGFIATPVRPPETRPWQLFAVAPGPDELQRYVTCNRLWSGMSDHYATFRTNDPAGDAEKQALVAEIHERGKTAIAYTTYDHVEDGAVEVPSVWLMLNAKGKRQSSPIGRDNPDYRRTFCCPGSRDWVDWKIKDIETAVRRYQLDGFYVDTSYVIMGCTNGEHGHGWLDADGQRQVDFPVWSQREVWRRAYETLYRLRGRAEIYAHHKGGCPAALAAYTTAFCDGEQYTSQPIKNLTLDAFRAQIAGRNMGPLGLFLCEYYRSQSFGMFERSGHHNPSESVMLSLAHGILPTGYPGDHPVRELLKLRDDLGIAEAAWTPYYAADNPWKTPGAEGLAVSAYHTARGDTLLVVSNPEYTDAACRLTGPADATEGRQFVVIDVLARVGRHSPFSVGYRWEGGEPARVAIPARSLGLFAWVRRPESLAGFAGQHGFANSPAEHARHTPVPEGATLLDDFEDPDWTLASDDGGMSTTEREPVDTRRALRVLPAPKHSAAALLRTFDAPQDWSSCRLLRFWIRPDKDLPVRALEVRLRDGSRYGPALGLASHQRTAVLPAGKWTQVEYEFVEAPRQAVHILRIYFDRGDLLSGPFDLDEMFLCGGHPGEASADSDSKKPESKRSGDPRRPPPPIDRPGAAPE